MHLEFRMPIDRGDLGRLSDEIVAVAVPLRNLQFTDRFSASIIGLLAVLCGSDMDFYHVLKEMGVEESSNRVGALLAQLSFVAFIFFDCEYLIV